MAITLDGSNGIGTPDLESTGPIAGTTGTFSGNVTANGLPTELRPLVLDTAKASTSGTTVDFTGIPSWVKRVTVMLSDVSLSGASTVMFRLGDSGGVETTGYRAYGSVTTNAVASAAFSSGFGIHDNSHTSTSAVHGFLTFVNITGNVWVGSGVFGDQDNTASTYTVSGSKTLSGTLDRIRITTVNGTDTFDAGTINIMYE